jgi:hypothetical protein
VVTIEIIKEAPSADQKSSTSSALLHLAVSINIAALITKENSPRESKIAGRVSNLTIDPITPLIRPNNKATHRYVQAPPLTVKLGINELANQNERAPEIRRTRINMV